VHIRTASTSAEAAADEIIAALVDRRILTE
jgi:hypothetical protein